MKGNKNTLAYILQQAMLKFKSNIALKIGSQSYSYQRLLENSTAISNIIRNNHISQALPVAILGGKTFDIYTAICGTLFASHAYMPLNLKYPAARNLKMLELSGAEIIVADWEAEEMLHQLLKGINRDFHIILHTDPSPWRKAYPRHQFVSLEDDRNIGFPEIISGAEDIAYLLFTSGTTGKPKGVPVSNRNVLAYLDHVLNTWDFREDDRFSHTFDLTFDLSVHDMMVCWLSGACLCVPEEETPFKLASYIKEQEISVWFSVPSAAVLMNKMRLLKPGAYPHLRLSFFCGEPLPENIADKWSEATGGKAVINLYGPSEATIAITAYEWDQNHRKSKNGIVCIGRCFRGQEYILLENESLIINKNKGEFCLGGSQVISSYLNDEMLSKQYFIQIPEEPNKIWYRTGDLVEVDDAGDIFFLGRLDAEVKISGYRVNLLEVDAVIRKVSKAGQAASILDERGSPRIISYVEKTAGPEPNEIIRMCRKELPWYMIPEVIIFVDEMPLNANGKVDRNELKKRLNDA